jgi:hypothetical protein
MDLSSLKALPISNDLHSFTNTYSSSSNNPVQKSTEHTGSFVSSQCSSWSSVTFCFFLFFKIFFNSFLKKIKDFDAKTTEQVKGMLQQLSSFLYEGKKTYNPFFFETKIRRINNKYST